MKEALKVSRILHAGYVFEHENVKLLFDPIFENPFSQNCHAFPQVRFDQVEIRKQKFAAVFISHYHDDHCSLASLDLIDRGTPIFIYCIHDELLDLLREFGFLRVEALQIGIGVKVGPFEIIPRLALDADVDSLFQIKVAGLNILNVVDSWIDSHSLQSLARSAPWDLVLWPFQTMREIEVLSPRRAKAAVNSLPAEWLTQLQLLKPRIIVPSSCQFKQEAWSWYNNALFPVSYRQFQQEIQQLLPESQVVRLNPSVTLLLHKNSFEYADPLSWVEPVGEQNVDYEYRPELYNLGFVHITNAPLYEVDVKYKDRKETIFCVDDTDYEKLLKDLPKKGGEMTRKKRNKGLGESSIAAMKHAINACMKQLKVDNTKKSDDIVDLWFDKDKSAVSR